MVKDSFSGKDISRGTGIMYVKNDGTIYYFANKKSEKNFFKLKRIPEKTKWSEFYHKEKKTMKEKLQTEKKQKKRKKK